MHRRNAGPCRWGGEGSRSVRQAEVRRHAEWEQCALPAASGEGGGRCVPSPTHTHTHTHTHTGARGRNQPILETNNPCNLKSKMLSSKAGKRDFRFSLAPLRWHLSALHGCHPCHMPPDACLPLAVPHTYRAQHFVAMPVGSSKHRHAHASVHVPQAEGLVLQCTAVQGARGSTGEDTRGGD